MRYSRGHQDITCQGCHESIHGLYPVAPDLEAGPGTGGVDTSSYAQAAYLISDNSHGPLKRGACHIYKQLDDGMDGQIPTRVCAPGEDGGNCDEAPGLRFNGKPIAEKDRRSNRSWPIIPPPSPSSSTGNVQHILAGLKQRELKGTL